MKATGVTAEVGWLRSLSLYLEYRTFLILLLGFSSGLPLLLVGQTLTFWLREEGVSLTDIGLFGLVGSAYALKFLWAPIVDKCPLPFLTYHFGRRRGWLLFSQLLVLSATLALGASDPGSSQLVVAGLAAALAFASATQDIVVDAYRIEVLDDERMGIGASNYVVGYRVATLVAGAGALLIADAAGWFVAYSVMAGFVLVGITATLSGPEPEAEDKERQPAEDVAPTSALSFLVSAVYRPFYDFATRRNWLLILVFIALYKYGDALLGAMASPFYVDIGFTKTEVGLVTKVFGLAMTILGGVIGGLVVARLGVMAALVLGGIVQAASNAIFAVQAMVGNELAFLFVTIGVENLTGGIGTIAFVAYISGLTNVAHTATQFALLTSMMAFARTVLSAGGGWLADQMDWVTYFLLTGVAAVPGLLLLWWLIRSGAGVVAPTPASPDQRESS